MKGRKFGGDMIGAGAIRQDEERRRFVYYMSLVRSCTCIWYVYAQNPLAQHTPNPTPQHINS